MRREYVLPIAAFVLLILLMVTVWQLAGALGRASVLEEQVDALQDSIQVDRRLRLAAEATTDSLLAQVPLIQAQAAVAVAEVQAELSVQEAEGEAAFRRAQAALEDNPFVQRLVEEMDAEFRVQGMIADSVIAEGATQLLIAQSQLTALTTAMFTERETSSTERARLNQALDLAIQRGDELERAIAPGFLRNLFQNFELVAVTAAVSAGITFLLTR